MHTLLHKIASGIVTASLALASLFGYHAAPALSPLAGAAPQFTAAKPSSLYGGGIGSSDTSIKLTALVTPAGTAITTANLIGGVGSVFYITIEPATTKKETVSCTAVTQNSDGSATLTGCTRGLAFTYPYTAIGSLALSHAGGSSVVLSNSPQLYQDIIAYVNGISVAGVVDASLVAKGVVQVATGQQAASTTAIGGGSTSAPLDLTTTISTSTYNGTTDTNNPGNVYSGRKVVITQNNGKIDENFSSTTLSQSYTFTGNNNFLNTTATTTFSPNRFIDTSGNQPLWTFLASSSVSTGADGCACWLVTSFPARKLLRVYINIPTKAATQSSVMIFNGDSAINYSYAFGSTSAQLSGQGSGLGVNAIRMSFPQGGVVAGRESITLDIQNPSATEHRVSGFNIVQPSATAIGSTTNLYGLPVYGSWSTTTAQQITSIIASSTSVGDAFPGATIYVYGSAF